MRDLKKEKKYPQRGNFVSYFISRFILGLMGWKVKGEFPDIPKFVIVAAPHTSNWDFIVTMCAVFILRVRISFMIKASLVKIPLLKHLIKWLGGIPVERSSASGVVDQTIETFNNRSQLILGITPEGTRSNVDKWKTGFYHIAVSCNIPIIPVSIDFKNKTLGVGEMFKLTRDKENDINNMKEYFSKFRGKK